MLINYLGRMLLVKFVALAAATWVFSQGRLWAVEAGLARDAGHLGIVLGAPTGMTIDFHADRSNRLFVDVGALSDDLGINAGWQHRFPGLIMPRDRRLALASYLGAAIYFRFDQKTVVGAGPVLMQELMIENSPFSFFIRLIPLIRMAPSVGYNLSAVAGAVFSF